MLYRLVCIFCFALAPITLFAQGSAGSSASLESRFIVDMPTAGVLSKSKYAINLYAFANNGIVAEWSIAPLANLNIGASFGGTHITGAGTPVWQDLPGFHLRFRPIDETHSFPAILLGASTQGRGIYSPEHEQFQVQSPGVFAVASKSFRWAGTLALHGGIHYSFEPSPANRVVNPYIGIEKSIGSPCAIHLEYNAGLYAKHSPLVQEGGLLNAAVRYSLGQGFTLELQLQDILLHYRQAQHSTRTLAIEYVGKL